MAACGLADPKLSSGLSTCNYDKSEQHLSNRIVLDSLVKTDGGIQDSTITKIVLKRKLCNTPID